MSVKKFNSIVMLSLVLVLHGVAQSPTNPTISPAVTNPCYNVGFESTPVGTYSALPGWTLGCGSYTNFSQNGYCNNYPLTGSLVPAGNIVTTPMAYTTPSLIPISPFFGNRVLYLTPPNSNGELTRAERTFSVTSTNKFLEYAYIFSTSHNSEQCCDAAYMKIILLDNANNAIPCGSIAISGSNGSYSACTNPTSVPTVTNIGYAYSANWIINNYDLTPYIGTNVKLSIEVGKCTAGGHYTTLFFDARCNGSSMITANGSINGNTVTVCNANNVANINFIAAASHTWNGPPTSSISNIANAGISTSVSGVYSVSMINPNCGSAATYTYLLNFCANTTALNENLNLNRILIYPNPSSGVITIKGEKALALRLTDVSGKELDHFVLSPAENYSYRKDMIPKGIYFISGDGVNQKIVVCSDQ
jgi:hypothetical protein